MYQRLLLIACLSATLNGCMTMYNIGVATNKNTVTESQVVSRDVIHQFGSLQMSNQLNKSLVLLGDNYSYVVDEAPQSLQHLSQLNDDYIHLLLPINITRFDTNRFDAKIDFDYKKPSQQYTIDEVNILSDLCQKVDIKSEVISQYYKCQIRLNGKLYQPLPSVSNALDDRYDDTFQLTADISEEQTTDKRALGRLAALPLAVTADIVTLPFQLLWMGSALAAPLH